MFKAAERLITKKVHLAMAAGVHRETLYEWLKDPTFSDTLATAYGRGISYLHGSLVINAATNPQAARFLLEQYDRQQYGKRLTIGLAEQTTLIENFVEVMDEYARKAGIPEDLRRRLTEGISRGSRARLGTETDIPAAEGTQLQLARKPAVE